MPHGAETIGKVRLIPPVSDGPANGPTPVRLSAIRQGVTGSNARAVGSLAATKYPLMSRMTCVGLLATMLMVPPAAPAATMAALDLTRPSKRILHGFT